MIQETPWLAYQRGWIRGGFQARQTPSDPPGVSRVQDFKDPTTQSQFPQTPLHSQDLSLTGTLSAMLLVHTPPRPQTSTGPGPSPGTVWTRTRVYQTLR